MLYAFRGEFIIFDDTVRVQDAVFESGQERLAVVGHRVVSAGTSERYCPVQRQFMFLWLVPCPSLSTTHCRHLLLKIAMSACSLDVINHTGLDGQLRCNVLPFGFSGTFGSLETLVCSKARYF